jgi:cation transport ATPase
MKKLSFLVIVLISFSSYSQEKKNKNAKYSFDVNGVCEMCKKRIEKAAFSVSGVKSATWNIENHLLQVIINEEKTAVNAVKKAIATVGHDIDSIKSTEEDFKKLHGCCVYERK